MRVALSDTTVLSNFAHAQRPDLLRALFASLYVPASVSEELARGERGGLELLRNRELRRTERDDFEPTPILRWACHAG
jgi:predicted nucleic acid-binding protein